MTRRQHHRGGQAARHQPPHPASQDQRLSHSHLMINITQFCCMPSRKERRASSPASFRSSRSSSLFFSSTTSGFIAASTTHSRWTTRSSRTRSNVGQGFTTKFLRPYALSQFSSLTHKSGIPMDTLFPAAKFPRTRRAFMPDTYNAPGYPYLLAELVQTYEPGLRLRRNGPGNRGQAHVYGPDRVIPWLNQVFLGADRGTHLPARPPASSTSA